MATPRIVARQLAQAEALEQAQQDQQAQQPPVEVVTTASQLPQETPAPPESAAPQAPPPPVAPTENWEQKFKTLQGMYNTDVPQLRTQEKIHASEVIALKEQVRALSAAQQAKPAEQQPKQIDPRDVESFGADMIEMVQRYASQTYEAIRNEFGTHAAQIDSRLKELENRIVGVSTKTDSTLETQFYATLKQLVPDWREINASEAWLAWLAEVDPVYGVPRQTALDAAHERGNVEHVANVFRMFKSMQPAKPSAALAAQVSPTGTGAGVTVVSTPAAPQMISSKFIQNFYADQLRGKYKGREAEAVRIETQINQAAAEGRIV